jgi:NAD(P)H-dependent FMN reductase
MKPYPMLKIAIIVGSTRPGRKGEAIAKWAHEVARKRTDADFALLDLATFELPLLDKPMPATPGSYDYPHTRTWSVQHGRSGHREPAPSEVGV